MRILVHNDGKLDHNLSVPDVILSLLPESEDGENHNILRSSQISDIDDWSGEDPPEAADLILTTNFHYAMALWARGKPVHWLVYRATKKNITHAIEKFLETIQ